MDFEWAKDQPKSVEVGDRIKLMFMPDDPHPLDSGSEGVVTSIDKNVGVINVKWDNGSSLSLIIDVDQYEILNESDSTAINNSMPKPTLTGKNISPARSSMNNTFKKELTKGKVHDIKVEDDVKDIKPTPSGIAKKHNIDLNKIQKEIEFGMGVEMEHMGDPVLAKQTTLDNLNKSPNHYSEEEKGLGVVQENTIVEFFNAFDNKDNQYNTQEIGKDLKRITGKIKKSSGLDKDSIKELIEGFRVKYSEHSMIDTMMKSLYHEFDDISDVDIEETTSMGGMGAGMQYTAKLESKIIKLKDLLESTTTINSGKYDNESKSPFDKNGDGWYWNDKPFFDGGEIVDTTAKLKTNWKDNDLTVKSKTKKIKKEDLLKKFNLVENDIIDEEEIDETTTSSSSGQFSGPMFAAKDDSSWNMGKKPIWAGGKIVQKVKNSGVLSELNKVKWHKDGTYVKLKDSCTKYNNQPWCSNGDADKPLILSKTTSDNISEVAKKLGISEEDVKKVVIKRLTR